MHRRGDDAGAGGADAGGDGVDGGGGACGSRRCRRRRRRAQPLVVGEPCAWDGRQYRRRAWPGGGCGSPRWAASSQVGRLDGDGARRPAHGEGAVLRDGAGERPGAGQDLGPAGGPSGDGDDAQPGRCGARDGLVGRRHERAAVGEGVVDVAEDAAQLRGEWNGASVVRPHAAGTHQRVVARSLQKSKLPAGFGASSIVGVRSLNGSGVVLLVEDVEELRQNCSLSLKKRRRYPSWTLATGVRRSKPRSVVRATPAPVVAAADRRRRRRRRDWDLVAPKMSRLALTSREALTMLNEAPSGDPAGRHGALDAGVGGDGVQIGVRRLQDVVAVEEELGIAFDRLDGALAGVAIDAAANLHHVRQHRVRVVGAGPRAHGTLRTLRAVGVRAHLEPTGTFGCSVGFDP